VLVTDEDDCSVRAGGEDVLNPTSAAYPGDLSLRCFNYKDSLTPIARYVDGFRALRAGTESRLIVGAITGVPIDLITSGTPDYDAILDDPRMLEVLDTGAASPRLTPSCNVPGRGVAFPPRRIVEVVRDFGTNGVVQSICQASFAGALDTIVARIAAASDPRGCAP